MPNIYTIKTQAGYAADLLYIIALAISKLSILVLLWQTTPICVYRRMALAARSLVETWTLASFFAIVFQCSVPDTRSVPGQSRFDGVWVKVLNICTSMLLNTAYTTANLILDNSRCVILIVLLTYTVWNLHTSGISRRNQQRLRVHLHSLCSILEFLAATTAGDGREHELQRIDDVCGDCNWHDILLHMGKGRV